MASLDFSEIEKMAEEAVEKAMIRGAQRAIGRMSQMLGVAGSSEAAEKPAKSSSRARAPRLKKHGQKRTPFELAELTGKVHAHIKANPGQGVEQIGKALGVSTDELKLPVKKLVASGHAKTKGEKRGTRYFAA